MTSRIARRGAIAESYQTPSGLSIVSYNESASGWNNTTGTTRTISGLSVVSGDILVVFGAQEDVSGTFSAPTATGVTFTSRQANASANNCRTVAYTGPITTTNASLSLSCTVPVKFCGICAFLVRGGAYGTSVKETNTTEAPAVDLTATKAGSIGLYIQADWNAGVTTGKTFRTINSIVGTERAALQVGGKYTVYVGSWSDLGATGTKTFGLSAPTGQQTSQIAVEITTP